MVLGSLDSGNSITVDKPPAALWIIVASARIFGFISWSLLVPQARWRASRPSACCTALSAGWPLMVPACSPVRCWR